MQRAMLALQHKTTNKAAGIAVLVFIFGYSPFYNVGNNALAYTYMVELFPYSQRSRGIAVEQLFVRGAGFFTTFINPIGYVMCLLFFSVLLLLFFFFFLSLGLRGRFGGRERRERGGWVEYSFFTFTLLIIDGCIGWTISDGNT